MLQISASAIVAVIISVSFALVFTKNHDMLMVRACRCYSHSKLKANAILDYVNKAWKVFPYLLALICVCSYVITYELLKSI